MELDANPIELMEQLDQCTPCWVLLQKPQPEPSPNHEHDPSDVNDLPHAQTMGVKETAQHGQEQLQLIALHEQGKN